MDNPTYRIRLSIPEPKDSKVNKRELFIEVFERGSIVVSLLDTMYIMGDDGFSKLVTTQVGYGHWTFIGLMLPGCALLLPTLEALDTHLRYHTLQALYDMSLPPKVAQGVVWSLIPKMCEEREEILCIFEQVDISWLRDTLKKIRQGFEKENLERAKKNEARKSKRKASKCEKSPELE